MENDRLDVNLFETSLPLRLDYEAMLAYLLLPPAGGVILLVMEHKSDYVRFVKLEERGVACTQLLPVKSVREQHCYAAARLIGPSPIYMSLPIDCRLDLPLVYMH